MQGGIWFEISTSDVCNITLLHSTVHERNRVNKGQEVHLGHTEICYKYTVQTMRWDIMTNCHKISVLDISQMSKNQLGEFMTDKIMNEFSRFDSWVLIVILWYPIRDQQIWLWTLVCGCWPSCNRKKGMMLVTADVINSIWLS